MGSGRLVEHNSFATLSQSVTSYDCDNILRHDFVTVMWSVVNCCYYFADSVESTALRLITGLGSSEVQPQLSRFNTEPKQVLKIMKTTSTKCSCLFKKQITSLCGFPG